MADLDNLDSVKACDDGAVLQLRHPTTDTPLTNDDGSPMTITMLGVDSPRYKQAVHARGNRRIQAATRTGRISTMEAQEADGIDNLVAATIAWDITFKGEKPKFDPVAVGELYRTRPWVKEQVDRFVGDRANFMKA